MAASPCIISPVFTIFFLSLAAALQLHTFIPHSLVKPKPPPSPSSRPRHSNSTNTFFLHLLHADSILPTGNLTPTQLLRQRLLRDSSRTHAIFAMAAAATANSSTTNPQQQQQRQPSGLEFPVISLCSAADFLAMFGLGIPPQQVALVVDTASDLTWTQCSPCNTCYPQLLPLFRPSSSPTYTPLSCMSSNKYCYTSCLDDDLCTYKATYADASFSFGELASEVLTSGGTAVNQVIGCGHSNKMLLPGPSGVLAIGRGELSFPSQISPLLGSKRFSYCMSYHSSNNWVVFGGSEKTVVTINILSCPQMPSFYLVDLTAVVVGGERVPVGSEDRVGGCFHGAIFDSGTVVTKLGVQYYNAVREVFRRGMESLVFAGSFSLFDSCYHLSGAGEVEVPTVELEFEGSVRVKLPWENYLIPVDEVGTMHCFAFAGMEEWPPIIGTIQMQGFQVFYDLDDLTLGFSSAAC